mmetsp:Transcript_14601/g.18046  ORF Transcript_14601/g.18046 Transcript_14601/m.18046 type:complete len:89 (-) Transcript_14601:1276-1542(-)
MLTSKDRLIVVACDGVWERVRPPGNEEMVKHVNAKLDIGKSLVDIIEGVFGNMISPNPRETGLGGDNMTCILVLVQNMVPQRRSCVMF